MHSTCIKIKKNRVVIVFLVLTTDRSAILDARLAETYSGEILK